MNNAEFKDKLVSINRITKVVKGGRRFAFSALVVVGDQSGSIGIGHGKAKQVPDAIKKATETAKRKLFKISNSGISLEIFLNASISKSNPLYFLINPAKRIYFFFGLKFSFL